ncbi:MAG TPA: MFS transporter [Coxiellaceae bacterium]|nr:MFS transporter [Coxiellaceae bacterium]
MFFTLKRMTMLIISIALFMDVIDSNVINTAVPAMAHTFSVNPIDIKVALISYLLSLAVFIPMSGWTADKYGVKNIFIGAIALFTITSFFCGYARTLPILVIARFIQGIGGAFMISLGRLVIARTFKRHELVAAMNTVIIVVSVGVMVGPFVGGVIVDYLSWPWIFWVNLPIGVFLIILAAYKLKETTPKNPRPFDFLGFLLFGGSLSLLCYSLSEMSESHVDFDAVMMRFFTAFLMLIAYCFYALRKKFPVIKITLFRIRTFRVSVFGNLCARFGFGGIPFLLPLLQQVALGFSPQLSGLLLMPIAFGIMFSKVMAIKILRALGYKKYLIINTFFVGFSLLLFQLINAQTPIYTIACMTFIFGVFISAQYTAMNSLALADVEDADLSASTSITSTTQILAQSLGVAVGAIFLRIYSFQLNKKLLLTPLVFHYTFLSLAVLTFLSSLMFLHLKTGDGKRMLMKVESEG